MQKELNMIEPQRDLPRVDRMERPIDMAEALAAVIAITRRDWLAQDHACAAPGDTVIDRARYGHPLSGLDLRPQRAGS